jgi:hypothetical protein
MKIVNMFIFKEV